MPSKRNYVSGFGDKDPDAAAFLKPSNTNPREASASGHGYQGERWDDNEGYSRGLGAYADDDKAFRKPSNARDDGDSAVQSIANQVFAENGPPGPVRQVKRGK